MVGKLSDSAPDGATQLEALVRRTPSKPAQIAAIRSEHDELRSSMRVMEAVIGELAERVELLETRATVRDAADAVTAKR